MHFRKLTLIGAFLGLVASVQGVAALAATEDTQFYPALVYRTGAYAPNGVPFANGYIDYLKLTNERGGINGMKVSWEECETGYATDKGVECYERLKNKNGGASVFQPLSTGITFALTDKAPVDKIPLITAGYGRSESQEGRIFKWNFPLTGTYWMAADAILQQIGNSLGGLKNLKGKKIALIYHDSPYGKEPIPLLEARAKELGFKLELLPVTHPGVDQKSTWLQIRKNRPDYVLLWGWGVMNSTALKEAIATGYPLNKMYGGWWSGAEPDVKDVGEAAKGYNAVMLQHGAEPNSAVAQEVLAKLHANGKGTGPEDEVGSVLYMRGLTAAMYGIEGARAAQERWGKGKHMTPEQVRWGIENLDLTQGKLNKLGFEGVLSPITTSCKDHVGATQFRVHTWDGKKFVWASDWLTADTTVIQPLVDTYSKKYAAEKKITPRTGDDCDS